MKRGESTLHTWAIYPGDKRQTKFVQWLDAIQFSSIQMGFIDSKTFTVLFLPSPRTYSGPDIAEKHRTSGAQTPRPQSHNPPAFQTPEGRRKRPPSQGTYNPQNPRNETPATASQHLCISQFQAWPSPGDSHVLTARGLGFRTFSLPGVWVFTQLSLPGGRGFELEKFSYSLERKMQKLFDLFQRDRGQLEKRVFLCCFISIFAKQCIFNNTHHFRPLRSFW